MDKALPVVEITLDKPRHLKYDFNAIRAIERETGKNLLKDNIWRDLSGTNLLIMVWAGLLHEDKNLKLEDVGAMFDLSHGSMVTGKVLEAWGLAVPEPREGEDPLPQSRPTG